MPRECIKIAGLHMGTNFILSVCSAKWSPLQFHDFPAFSPFPFVSRLFMSLCLKWHTCVSMNAWDIDETKWNHKHTLSQGNHTMTAYCNVSLRRYCLTHQVRRGNRFSLWFLPPDDLSFYSFPGLWYFLSLVAIKMQGLCKITSLRTKFVMTECHVYPPSPKVSYWWQRLDFWSKIVWTLQKVFQMWFWQSGLRIVLRWLRFDWPNSRGPFPGSYVVAPLFFLIA